MIADPAASPVRCAIYSRVSTEEQGREGASLPPHLQAEPDALGDAFTFLESGGGARWSAGAAVEAAD